MNSPAGWRWARLAAGVTLALLAAGFVFPSGASASCGDYVQMGTAGQHAGPKSAAQPSTTPMLPHLPPSHQAPCSGPNCSRKSPLPAPIPAPPGPERNQQWGHAAEPLPGVGSDCAVASFGDPDADRPVRRGLPIYHPPR